MIIANSIAIAMECVDSASSLTPLTTIAIAIEFAIPRHHSINTDQ